MNNKKVMTAPLAVIKVNGVAVGKMKNIRVTETIRRATVKGLGQLHDDEKPAVDWSGSLSCSFFTINFEKAPIPGLLNRHVQTIEDWTNSVLLQEDGVQIDILKKVIDPATRGQAVKKAKYEIFASIQGNFITRNSFDISEGQVSGTDVECEYLTPILYQL